MDVIGFFENGANSTDHGKRRLVWRFVAAKHLASMPTKRKKPCVSRAVDIAAMNGELRAAIRKELNEPTPIFMVWVAGVHTPLGEF